MKEKSPHQEEFVPIPQDPTKEKVKKVDFDKEIKAHAERARVSGFIHLGYLDYILAYEERYSVILPRLWEFFQAWDQGHFNQRKEIQTETYQDRCEAWLGIFRKWGGIDKQLWKRATPLPIFPLYDSVTKEFKKEGSARSDKDLVKLEDLKKQIQGIGKTINIDFPLPSLLFPESKDERKKTDDTSKPASFVPNDDFRCVNKDGRDYSLTSMQAGVIEALYQAHQRGAPDLSEIHLLDRVHSESKHLTFLSTSSIWR